jgi:hypothetical protein
MVIGESAKRAAYRARVVLLPLLGAAFCWLATPAASFASSSPTSESVSISNITEHDATLESQINTQGLYTGYWFQIDTNSSYDFTQADCPFDFPGDAECQSITDGEPLPAGLVEPHPEYIQTGSGDQSVRLDLASIGATLQPATTYHYRVLATSGGEPTVVYPDQTFETLGTPWTPPVPIEPLPVNLQIEKEFEEHPPWDHAPSSPSAEAPTAVVAKGGVLPKPKALTSAQKLAEALKACKRESKRKQASSDSRPRSTCWRPRRR